MVIRGRIRRFDHPPDPRVVALSAGRQERRELIGKRSDLVRSAAEIVDDHDGPLQGTDAAQFRSHEPSPPPRFCEYGGAEAPPPFSPQNLYRSPAWKARASFDTCWSKVR